MIKKITGHLPALAFLSAVIVGGTTLFALPKNTWSYTERRPLASAPEFSSKNFLNGHWFSELDTWMADHFQARETFRHMRVVFQTGILNESEYNGFIEYEGSIVNLQKDVNEASISYAADRFEAVWQKYLQNKNVNIYQTIVPDKSSLLEGNFPTLDTGLMDRLYGEALPFANPLSLRGLLTLEDYYLTDTHWRQEALIPVAQHILKEMGRDTSLLNGNFKENSLYPFLGVYAGQSAMAPAPETIFYLTGGYFDGLSVIDLETHAPMLLYDPQGCDERDLYTMFLGGGKGLIRIDNPSAPEGELILFRDSFGSSMAPLLTSAYSRVYVVDLRYVHPDVLGRFIRFNGSDVLFMFSETLLNNSQGLR